MDRDNHRDDSDGIQQRAAHRSVSLSPLIRLNSPDQVPAKEDHRCRDEGFPCYQSERRSHPMNQRSGIRFGFHRTMAVNSNPGGGEIQGSATGTNCHGQGSVSQNPARNTNGETARCLHSPYYATNPRRVQSDALPNRV